MYRDYGWREKFWWAIISICGVLSAAAIAELIFKTNGE